ncbi:hypothetical protein R3W88_000820 [Solanum pinnatisectum]|uniref:Uncharacterized protein n=1 Tax=Solanum pinnatisectum TaxID=50273 RepID=A0AAV9MGM4_9SOLN|nr:hypothetical protein R3W88_000820 [Solanum pinnatisectum]
MNVCRPHGCSKRMRLGYFVVLFWCAFLWTLFLAICALALQSRYWISPDIKKKGLCYLILFGISSDISCVVWVSTYLLCSLCACNDWVFQSMNCSFLPNQRVPSLFVKTTVVWKFSTMIKISTSVFVLCSHKVFCLDAYFLG